MALVPAPQARAQGNAQTATKRVFVLSSFGRDFSPYSLADSTFRTELSRSLGAPVDYLEVTLGTRSIEPHDEAAIVEYARAVSTHRPPDLVVTIGPLAGAFRQRYRSELFPGVPTLYGALEERWARAIRPSPLETVVGSRIDLKAIMENILHVLPETEEVFVVLGDSPIERRWLPEARRGWDPFQPRVRVTYLAGLSFDEILRRTAALPPRSAVLFALMLRDVAGVPFEHESALERLCATASAPVFGWSTVMFGRGIVGGPLMNAQTPRREMARFGDRSLRGESPGSIPAMMIPVGSPVYDARELARWRIDERRLPPGSEVRFRQPSFIEQYSGRILAVAALLLLQALAIATLLVSRRRRQRAEQEAARLRSELAHVGRVTVLGQLSSSLAHELSQPLGAILRNAEAAELFLATEAPDLAEIRSIVADIKADDRRAGDVIERMRSFLRRQEPKRSTLDPAPLVEGVLTLVGPELRARGIRLETTVARELPTVTGDPVHLQQVLLNLLVNAMEAMEKTPRDARDLSVVVRAAEGGALEIAVRDSGPGIPPGEMARIFEPFHTTKPAGLGMGLAISRALVEGHGGHLRLDANESGGATFVVSLPSGGVPA